MIDLVVVVAVVWGDNKIKAGGVFELSKISIPAQYPIGKRNTSARVERRTMKAEIAAPARVEGEPRLKQHQNAWKYIYDVIDCATSIHKLGNRRHFRLSRLDYKLTIVFGTNETDHV